MSGRMALRIWVWVSEQNVRSLMEDYGSECRLRMRDENDHSLFEN